MVVPPPGPPGTLYVVATPLGNLDDVSRRAQDMLRSVAIVAAEDTRRTRGLLTHLGARPRLLSFHEHSPPARAAQIREALKAGQDVALVSDAGTPVLSDPGALLIQSVRKAGIPVVPIPGPSAVATALSGAGLPADRFLFLGFLPRRGRERKRLLDRAADEEWTVVLFESPRRAAALLHDLANTAGPARPAVVAREMTKVHEEFRGGTVAELADYYSTHPPQGEVTILLEGRAGGRGRGEGGSRPGRGEVDRASLEADAASLLAQGMSRRSIVAQLTESTGLPRNEVYRMVMELKS